MAKKLIDQIFVPAEHAKAFRLYMGQTLRVIAIEGPQVGDMALFNARNYKETYDSPYSYMSNVRMGTGNGFRLKYLYSKLPKGNLMAEVTHDRVGKHWIANSGHCNAITNKIRGLDNLSRNCFDNIAETISEFGMTSAQVPNRFPIWMNFNIKSDGSHEILPALSEKGDFIDFFAHMHLLVSISACPGNQKNVTNCNSGKNKPLQVEIWEGSSWD